MDMKKQNNNDNITFMDLRIEREIVQEEIYINTIMNLPKREEEIEAVANIMFHYLELLNIDILDYEILLEEMEENMKLIKEKSNKRYSRKSKKILEIIKRANNLPYNTNWNDILDIYEKKEKEVMEEIYKLKRIKSYIKKFFKE